MRGLFIYTILFLPTLVFGQQTLTLEDCYELLKSNYPLAQVEGLLERQNEIDLDVINIGKLPQVDVAAQTTYQSDVIQVPIPTIEPLNNDQYRATVSINQLIYGGGAIDASLKARSAALKSQQKQVEVNLYQLKRQVNQLYFSILLSREKQELLTAKKQELVASLDEVKSGITNGILVPASDKVLEVELLKIEQQFQEAEHNELSLIGTLSSLCGKEIASSTILQSTEIIADNESEISRPELSLFQLKKDQIETRHTLLSKQNSPKILGFVTSGYGNPGLNMLDNSFQPFYTVGVRLNWKVFDWSANTKERESLLVNKEIIDNEVRIFELNTQIRLDQEQTEISKLMGFISSDLEIIKLRRDVLSSAESQLKNGVITTSAYIAELTNLFEDENTLSMHRIQLILVKANYNTTKGQ